MTAHTIRSVAARAARALGLAHLVALPRRTSTQRPAPRVNPAPGLHIVPTPPSAARSRVAAAPVRPLAPTLPHAPDAAARRRERERFEAIVAGPLGRRHPVLALRLASSELPRCQAIEVLTAVDRAPSPARTGPVYGAAALAGLAVATAALVAGGRQ